MTGDVIYMATAQFTYAVGLLTDDKAHGATTYDQSLSLLQEFLKAHDGKYLGAFIQDGIEYPEYAVVKMTRAAEDKLHDINTSALQTDGEKPFIQRIEGTLFNIGPVDGMRIYPVDFSKLGLAECTI